LDGERFSERRRQAPDRRGAGSGEKSKLGLLTAAVGMYGVMSYSVRCRTVIGFGIALASTRVVSGFLYGVSATDLVTFTAVPVILLAVAFVAIILPARRATRIEPMAALRHG